MLIKKLRAVALSLILPWLITACGPTAMYQATSNNIAATQAQISQDKQKFATLSPDVVNNSGIYVNASPVAFNSSPSWLSAPIGLHGSVLPLSFYAAKIADASGTTVSYDPSVRNNVPISLDYTGTVKGALSLLAAKTGYAFNIQGTNINWSNMVSRTFDISFMPGNSQYMVGGQEGGNSTSNSSSNSSAGGGATAYFGDDSNGSQYSALTGSLSVWSDLTDTLNKLKSKDGRVMVSEATTSVTVYDHPQNVAMMASYLNYLNHDLSKQVMLQVKVLEVDLNKSFNYGINWTLMYQTMGAQFGIQGANLDNPVNVMPAGGTSGSNIDGFTLGFPGSDSRWDGTSVVINALKQQGNVSIATENRVVTMNNQIAELGVNTLTGYLSQVSTTFTGTNGDFPTTSLTPGIVKTGFTLYILPKIQGHNVYLQITSNISNLLNIQSVCGSSNCSNTSASSSTANPNSATIQLPTITEKTFNQRSLVPTGNTLVIAGFKQLKDEADNDKMFTVPQSQGASNSNVETVILITPTILS